MAWGFLDWVRGRLFRPDPKKLTLSKNPSEAELRAMVLRLLDRSQSYDAYRLLDNHSERARPMLEEYLRTDDRFREMNTRLASWSHPAVFDVVLTILFKWSSDLAVEETIRLASSADPKLRSIAARLLASTGKARFAKILKTLTQDPDPEVRTAVGHGISDVLEYWRSTGRTFDDALGLALYDFMRDCALRTDRGPGNRFAAALLRADRNRAIRDFASDEALTMSRNSLRNLLVALHEASVNISTTRVKTLLEEAVAIFDRTDFSLRNYTGNRGLVEELIVLLAEKEPERARAAIDALRTHPQEEARGAAQDARERLEKTSPDQVVLEALNTAGGVLDLQHEHRVVYYVWLLDAEVCNGGWLQWVGNSSGEYARETAEALDEIGAPDAAAEVRKVIVALGPDGSSPSQETRMAAIDRMMSAGRALPEDSVIWKMSSDLHALIYDYAAAHPEAFAPQKQR